MGERERKKEREREGEEERERVTKRKGEVVMNLCFGLGKRGVRTEWRGGPGLGNRAGRQVRWR